MHTFTGSPRFLKVAALIVLAAAAARCASKPAASEPSPEAPLTPVLTVKELMENIVDPQADYVFDAVGVDVGPKGTVETKPTTDDDWTRIQRGAYVLAESANLLKMPRKIAPDGDKNKGGPGQPELSPDQIQAKIDENRTLWNTHADNLRAEALKVIEIVKARDTDKLFAAGSAIDAACESCHLDYWYPGDREAVLKDRNSRAYIQKPTSPKK
jgi:cytochrome c556